MIGFGEFGKKRELGIVSTKDARPLGIVSTEDARLLLIDPTSDGFFANVLEYVPKYVFVRKFIEAVREVQEAEIGKFWRPIYDPSIEGEEVVFKAANTPAVGRSFNFWKEKAEEMPTVDGKHWSIGSEYQYYAFLVWLINRKMESGWNIANAIDAVMFDSKELGHYRNSDNALNDFEKTGSREVCGVYDLANTFKLLSCTNDEVGGFWFAGGNYRNFSDYFTLADLKHFYDGDCNYFYSVGWLVLS